MRSLILVVFEQLLDDDNAFEFLVLLKFMLSLMLHKRQTFSSHSKLRSRHVHVGSFRDWVGE